MPTPKKGYGHPQQALHQYKQKNEDLMHLYVIKLLVTINYLHCNLSIRFEYLLF